MSERPPLFEQAPHGERGGVSETGTKNVRKTPPFRTRTVSGTMHDPEADLRVHFGPLASLEPLGELKNGFADGVGRRAGLVGEEDVPLLRPRRCLLKRSLLARRQDFRRGDLERARSVLTVGDAPLPLVERGGSVQGERGNGSGSRNGSRN